MPGGARANREGAHGIVKNLCSTSVSPAFCWATHSRKRFILAIFSDVFPCLEMIVYTTLNHIHNPKTCTRTHDPSLVLCSSFASSFHSLARASRRNTRARTPSSRSPAPRPHWRRFATNWSRHLRTPIVCKRRGTRRSRYERAWG